MNTAAFLRLVDATALADRVLDGLVVVVIVCVVSSRRHPTTDGEPASRARLLELGEGALLAEGSGQRVDLSAKAAELSVVDAVQEVLGQLLVGLSDKRYREVLGGTCGVVFPENVAARPFFRILDSRTKKHEKNLEKNLEKKGLVAADVVGGKNVAASVPLAFGILLDLRHHEGCAFVVEMEAAAVAVLVYPLVDLEFLLEGLELGGADAGEIGELADEIGHVGGVDESGIGGLESGLDCLSFGLNGHRLTN